MRANSTFIARPPLAAPSYSPKTSAIAFLISPTPRRARAASINAGVAHADSP